MVSSTMYTAMVDGLAKTSEKLVELIPFYQPEVKLPRIQCYDSTRKVYKVSPYFYSHVPTCYVNFVVLLCSAWEGLAALFQSG
jgi:hypothetical protein